MTKRFLSPEPILKSVKPSPAAPCCRRRICWVFHTAGYKPVASGSELTGDGLRNEDALALQRHSRVALRYDQ